jgi:hypothetical protein
MHDCFADMMDKLVVASSSARPRDEPVEVRELPGLIFQGAMK